MVRVDPHAKTATLSSSRRQVDDKTTPGLLVVYEGERGFEYRVVALPDQARVDIGRATECALCVADSSASRHHAVVHRQGSELSIGDQGSHNGTWLGGQRLGKKPAPLASGDLIRVGSSLIVVVDDSEGHVPHDAPIVGGKWARSVAELAARFGPTPLAVLLTGETGTGKEVVTAALHAASGRPGPLVSVNCAALPEALAESQLFGHRRGAFSGATEPQQGFFAAADRGTLFLDEVGELSPAVQVKLLRALESGQVVPVGATTPQTVNIRLLSATSRDLEAARRKQQFRLDLFHRLNGVTVWLAPLRERIEEISILSQHLLTAVDPQLTLSAGCLEALLLHSWPGNVRELKQAITAAAVSARSRGSDVVEIEDLRLQAAVVEQQQQQTAAAPEVAAVVEALRRSNGNVSQAANALGVHREQIYRVLRKNRLSSDDFRQP